MKYLFFIISGVTFFFFPADQSNSQTVQKNFIQEQTPLIENISEEDLLHYNYSKEEVMTGIDYYDGLIRPSQMILFAWSASGDDLITPFTYDDFGRSEKEYLSFVKSENNGQYIEDAGVFQSKYYANTPPQNIHDPQFPYAPVCYENAPLNRLIKQGYPGESWQINIDKQSVYPTGFDYTMNTLEIPSWKIKNNTIVRDAVYNPFELYVTTSIEPLDQFRIIIIEEYKDKFDRTLLTKVTGGDKVTKTYYVYDDFGLLRGIIPPVAAKDDELSETELNDFCYYYEYDAKQRMIKKKLPGINTAYMVYDSLNRIVLYQDGNFRHDGNKWAFYKYDIYNREILTGIYKPVNNFNQQQMQQYVNEKIGTSFKYYEDLSHDNYAEQHGYTDKAFPSLKNGEILTVKYYDDHDFNRDGEDDFHYNPDPLEFPDPDLLKSYKGALTGTKIRSIDKIGEDFIWLYDVTFCDKRKRVIQTQSNSHLNENNFDNISYGYDFTGKLLKTKNTNYTDPENPVVIIDTLTYDHAGRITACYQKINDQNKYQEIASSEYNEIGNLIKENLHATGGKEAGQYLQSIDYYYNLRGWLTQVNDPDNPFQEQDILFMRYLYDQEFEELKAEPYYNGNISSLQWAIFGSAGEWGIDGNGYGFAYDDLDRLKSAYYEAYDFSNGWGEFKDIYSLTGVQYDLNGNILKLGRRGQVDAGNYDLMDSLSYFYRGNQIIGVNDDIPELNNNVGDFEDNGNYYNPSDPSSEEYKYDENGNMAEDKNKLIDKVIYNFLDLPSVIDFEDGTRIEYYYDSQGIKLRKIVYYEGKIQIIYDYVKNFVYVNHKLDHVLTEKGRLVKINEEGIFLHEYFLRDHLGNVRATFGDIDNNGQPELMQKSFYYPYGLRMTHSFSSENKYLYNGKELQTENELGWYDYGARFYDPALGRWHVVDPLASEAPGWSPYRYGFDNPVSFTDPDGMFENYDWYQSETGNVIWQEGSAQNINVNGEEFTNIGKTYSAPMAGGEGYLNYFQNMPIAISSSKANVGQLLAKHNGIFRNAMSMAPTREMQSEIFMTRFNINLSDASKNVLIGTFAIPAAVLLTSELMIATPYLSEYAINHAVNIELMTGNISGLQNFIGYSGAWLTNSNSGSWLLAAAAAQKPPGMVYGFNTDIVKEGYIKITQEIVKSLEISTEYNENPLKDIDWNKYGKYTK